MADISAPGTINSSSEVQSAVVGPQEFSEGRMLRTFLRIGAVGFGGGMAVISLMEQEFVQNLGVVPAEEFVAGVGLSQILGAFPVNVAVFVGYRLFGLRGALLSVVSFLAPSVTLVVFLSSLYFQFHTIPALQKAILGLSPVVIALILNATWTIGRKALNTALALGVAACALVAGVLKINPVWIILASAIVGYLFTTPLQQEQPPHRGKSHLLGVSPSHLAWALSLWTKVTSVTFTFLKIGMVFFGGGFVLVAVLRDKLVSQLNWLTPKEFLDGLAISSLTPGPIAVISTFVGYHHAGVAGALAATIALFTPGVVFMVWISHQYGRFRHNSRMKRIMSGINPATVGLILSAAILLGWHSLVSWQDLVLLGLSVALIMRLRWHPAFVLAIGAVAGYVGLLR